MFKKVDLNDPEDQALIRGLYAVIGLLCMIIILLFLFNNQYKNADSFCLEHGFDDIYTWNLKTFQCIGKTNLTKFSSLSYNKISFVNIESTTQNNKTYYVLP